MKLNNDRLDQRVTEENSSLLSSSKQKRIESQEGSQYEHITPESKRVELHKKQPKSVVK